MAIRFYGDESEDKGQKVHAIGGFIGFAEDWDDLQERWTARIKPTGVSAYHMTDCESGFGEFRDWRKQDRNQLTIDLIELICQHNVFMLGTGVLLDDYKEIAPVNDDGAKLGHDKWHLVFQAVLLEAASRIGDKAPPEEKIAFFFDWKEKQGAAGDIFLHTKQEAKLKPWRHRLGSIAFGHKEFDVPASIPMLQVADIAAVETRKAIGNPITHPKLAERASRTRLKEAGRVWSITYLTRPILEILYELKRSELGLPNRAEEAEARLARMPPTRRRYLK